jgi:ubiquinone/menaquinone biosynthesis C-methylase UbiE
MNHAQAGTLYGDEAGAALDDISWSRLTPWRAEITRLDQELKPDLSNLVELLDRIPLAIWGQILSASDRLLGRADVFLPHLPTAAVQEATTGLSGGRLLRQSIAFVEQVVVSCAEAGVAPENAKVLDFGIGWGRHAMLWLKYARPESLVGCDAWESSLDQARASRLPIELVASHPMLDKLPFDEASLDVIYAFSVFTSLGTKGFPRCLGGLSRMLKPGGLVVFTVRPAEYWSLREDVDDALRQAERSDIYFQPYPDHEEYGDTSVSLQYLDRVCADAGLGRPSLEWFPADPHQIVVKARRVDDQ